MPAESALARWPRTVVDGFTFYTRAARELDGESTSGELTTAAAKPGTASAPPVVLLNGCALSAAGWQPVVDAAPEREFIAIDRPGFAGTRWPGTLPDLASEIATIDRAIADHPRGILVAHSMAAFRAEAFARLRPDRVAGLVLVDPSIEDYRRRGPAGAFSRATLLPLLGALTTRTEIGQLVSLLSSRGFAQQSGSGRALDEAAFRDPYADPDTLKAALAEWLSYRSQAADLRRLRTSTDAVRAPTSALMAPPLPSRRRRRILDAAFADLTRHEIDDSRHLMMIDRPDVIVEAVEEVDRR